MNIFKEIEERLLNQIEFKSIINKILTNGELSIRGLPGSMRALFLWLLSNRLNRPVLALLRDGNSAELLADELAGLFGQSEKAVFFPGHVEEAETPGLLNVRRAGLQMSILGGLLSGIPNILVTESLGAVQKLPPPEVFRNEQIVLAAGARQDMSELVECLIRFGYDREIMVERPGEISVRGGILDIYPYTGELPHRLEFYGNTIESIRVFDVASQRSTANRENLTLISSPLHWHERPSTLLDYFKTCPLIFIEDKDLVIAGLRDAHRHDPSLMDEGAFEGIISQFPVLWYSTFAGGQTARDMGGRGIERSGRLSQEIREHLHSVADRGNTIYVCGERDDQVGRITELLNLDENPIPGLYVGTAPIREGFSLPEANLVVYTLAELFGTPRKKKKHSRIRAGVPLRELSSLVLGDYVVHIDHGIGIYEGLKIIPVNEIDRECLSIRYQDDDRLYVPLEKMERVQKYASREGNVPVVSKLGGQRWERLKKRTKESVKRIAADLIKLYSERQTQPGFAFSMDTLWQKELEASFLYEETPDQAKAIKAVKQDMESGRPMDRLICGDVGYGKTEVAVRAAFKTVNDSKQVAVLVPTTLLAEQHFRTFSQRLSQYPVQVEVLSRFRSKSEQRRIVEGIKAGTIDIVIGTHRLLSRDIGFKDLGLLIIDEEQRFGVRHKERLKRMRTSVDVIALSATPIPRTLHLSLVGIRDMSLITTPPQDRLPIITEVLPFHEDIIISAIEKELERGGQIFFVHNRIRSIHTVAGMIRRLVPGIRLSIVHGQMEEKILEKTMMAFLDKQYDCLVSTMIVGSGLDIPNVNTLIVNRADQLGLSQLYQLRGRVGRSGRRAYAYLLTPPLQLLTSQAIKRLRTIEEYTELGAGFQIAMRDLEIRGTGNILGVQQSGTIDAVGFELYNRLVEEAVREIHEAGEEKGQSHKPVEVDCHVEADVPAYLPSTYIEDESQRVNLYRRLSRFQKIGDVDRFSEELHDRFGRMPAESENLLEVVRVRILAAKHGLQRVNIAGKKMHCYFHEKWVDNHPSPELFNRALRSFIDSSPETIRFLQGQRFGFQLELTEKLPLNAAKKLLQRWG